MKRLPWKYIAGFIDGEGCLDLQLTKQKTTHEGVKTYVRPRLRVSQAVHAGMVIESLHAHHGGNMRLHQHKGASQNPQWSDYLTWQIEGKRARPVLQNLVNHLVIKEQQARLAIFMIDKLMGKHWPDAAKEHLRAEMKAMKKDPHRLSGEAADIFWKIVEQETTLSRS